MYLELSIALLSFFFQESCLFLYVSLTGHTVSTYTSISWCRVDWTEATSLVWSDGSKILEHTCPISASTSTHDINVYISPRYRYGIRLTLAHHGTPSPCRRGPRPRRHPGKDHHPRIAFYISMHKGYVCCC